MPKVAFISSKFKLPTAGKEDEISDIWGKAQKSRRYSKTNAD